MSILDEVNKRLDEGRLYSVPQKFRSPWYPPGRTIYATGSIKTLVSGIGTTSQEERDRVAELWADLDDFLSGDRMDLRPLDSSDNEFAKMALLEPSSDEVWEYRSVAPSPAFRIFGSFAAKDVFVALTWARRKDLGPKYSKEWRAAIQEFKEEWEINFGNVKPFSGSYPDDYFANARVID